MSFTLSQALGLLKGAHRNHRMPHALLVTGSADAGTHQLALGLAEYLNGAHADSLETLRHPMCRLIRPGSKVRTITIDAVRSVEPFLTLRAQEHETKLIIIQDADRLSDDSANAFLKTLEEPPPQTLIILLTELPSRLLPTILSRCVRLDMAEPGAMVRLSEVQKRFLPAVEAAMAHMGSDVAALALRVDFQELLAQSRKEISARINATIKEESDAIKQATNVDWEALQKSASEAMIETECLGTRQQMLELLTLCLGQAVLHASHASEADFHPISPVLAEVAEQFPVADLLRRMKAVEQLRQDLSFNVHPELTLDARLSEIIGSSPL